MPRKPAAARAEVVQGPPAQERSLLPVALGQDQQFVQEAGEAVASFVGQIARFFGHAGELEVSAKALLDRAQAMPVPTTMEEDEGVQHDIREATAARKTASEHWDINRVLSRFHRRLTAAEHRTTDAIERASTILNGLHNTYTQNERRRVFEEQERQRREDEQRERERLAREAAELEAEAIKREEASADLSKRERTFVELYTGSYRENAQKAAQLAGFTKKPLEEAARLLSLPKIQAAVRAADEAARLREQARATREKPVQVETREVVVNISKAAGGSSRTTYGAEVLDEKALIEAVFAGSYGIPRDVLKVDHAKVNQYGNQFRELIDRWPGVRHTSSTKLVG